MNKNAVKKFATGARQELLFRVSQKALQYGISEKETGDPDDDSVDGRLLSNTEKKQREALIGRIKEKGYEQVMEEAAYTWFNRFSALRFMEVNGYLPTRIRVFTDENNAFRPQILTEAIHMELDGLDIEKVYAYKEANDDEELYKYLLITQCNALNHVLPGMFQKIADYTELLFPDNLLREGSVIWQMIELIPEEDWKDTVQIIGWLYQYYNSEKKDEVFAALKKNVKITKENIPAATQLFTPDWIVRYMVENSLGRLWVEGHPNERLKSQWKYYLEEAEQEPDVQAQLASIREEYKALRPEDILCIDPCSGSGHILAYMFDVLMQIYEAYGVDTRTAVASIVENNIYGLDIDDRAAQLAYFSVMMKACQYDKRFLRRKIQPHVYAIVESNHVDPFAVEYFCNGDDKLKAAMDTIIEELHDAKEYGSIITVSQQDWDALHARFDEIQNESVMSIYSGAALGLKALVQVVEVLSQKYDVVVTNPPYRGIGDVVEKLQNYVKIIYPDSCADLSTVFMERCAVMAKNTGLYAMINIPVWMSLASYSNLRKKILQNEYLVNMLHLGRGMFGSDYGTTAFVMGTNNLDTYKGLYCKFFKRQGAVENEEEKQKKFFKGTNNYITAQSLYSSLHNNIIAYWATDSFVTAFRLGVNINTYATVFEGLKTRDKDRFLRFWFEVSGHKWKPYAKGGTFRRWYGNNDYVVNWGENGDEVRNFKKSSGANFKYYFKPTITYTAMTMSKFTGRYIDNQIFGGGGGGICASDKIMYILAFVNSVSFDYIISSMKSTVNFEVGQIGKIPVLMDVNNKECIEEKAENNVYLSKSDWDDFEYSWDFQHHPLICSVSTIAEAYSQWENKCNNRYNQLKTNEEELNRIFIDIYGLQDELTPEVEDKDVTVRKADLQRDIRSFISYAVGCMFGRYSLDVDGLAYAGGEWDESKYITFPADADNIIPVSDDEYFEDDIVARFVKFVEVVYGTETLQENLKFIAEALGGKGTPKEVIRNYFLNGFYADHCKIYQKRPIYWLFDSGKKNGFKCLIYMHRYQPDTIARIRTDYVHEQQARYRTAIADLENRIANASASERVKLNKQLKKLNNQAAEIHEYEEKIHHLADQMISIDLDDGVKKNYALFRDVLVKIK